jgi:hypothetical protein
VTFTEEELGLGVVQHKEQEPPQPAATAGGPPPLGLHPPMLQQQCHALPPPGQQPPLGTLPLLMRSPPPPRPLPFPTYPQAAHATHQREAAPPQHSPQVPAPQKATSGKTEYGPDGFMPKEAAVAAFKALLADRGVHAFSRYEREVQKLQPDPRFKVGVCRITAPTWRCCACTSLNLSFGAL